MVSWLLSSSMSQLTLCTSVSGSHKLTSLIKYFFVSRPKSGCREGFEYHRVMYFSPDTEDLGEQTSITGFAEAFMTFPKNFRLADVVDAEYEHRFVKSTKLLEVFILVESGEYLLGLALDREACNKAGYFVHMTSIKSLIVRMYETFRVFYGRFSALFAVNSGELKQKLDQFFALYLESLQVHQIPLIDLFAGVDLFNMSPTNYLDIDCLVSKIQEEFPSIKKSVLLYHKKLVYYSVAKDDVNVLFRYLTQHVVAATPATPIEVLHPGSTITASSSVDIGDDPDSNQTYTGKFIAGAVDFIGQAVSADKLFPIVYLSSADGNKRAADAHVLVVYQARHATLCLFVPSSEMATLDLKALRRRLDPEVTRFAGLLDRDSESVAHPYHADIPFHYVYFNPDSLSLNSSFTAPRKTSWTATMPPVGIYKLVCEAYDHFIESNSDRFAQVELKSDDDWWIVFKRANSRLLTLFIQSGSSTQVNDIHELADKIVKKYFSRLFLV